MEDPTALPDLSRESEYIDRPTAENKHKTDSAVTDSAVTMVSALEYRPRNSYSLLTSFPNVACAVVDTHWFAEMPEREGDHPG
jgi:hypothetical protein